MLASGAWAERIRRPYRCLKSRKVHWGTSGGRRASPGGGGGRRQLRQLLADGSDCFTVGQQI